MPELILVVDDDMKLAHAATVRLSAAGYEVAHAATGNAALELASRRTPDLVVLDIRLPDIDGFEVCERLRAMPLIQNVPIVFVSANSSAADRQRAKAVGGTEFLSKPCPSSLLLGTIKALCDRRNEPSRPGPQRSQQTPTAAAACGTTRQEFQR